MIQNARPLLSTLVIKGGNLIGINPNGYAALDDRQREQMRKLLLEVAQNNLQLGQNILDTQKEINGLDSPSRQDIEGVLTKRKQKELEMFGKRIGVPDVGKSDGSNSSRYAVTIHD